MLDKLFRTLKSRLKREEKEWKKNSSVRYEHSYGILRNILFKFSKTPLLTSASLFMIFFSTSIFSNFYQIIEIPIGIEEYTTGELKSSIMGIWSVQATILGLIYPIVIAFVSLLLQKRHDARSFLNIYLHDTAGIFSGLCAIGLILLIGVQLYFLDGVNVSALFSWLYINLTFLILNLFLTAYFLYQTFIYLKPQSRLDSLKRYLINEIWPSEFRRKLGPHLFSNAIENNLIPIKGISNDLLSSEGPVLSTKTAFSSRYGVDKLSKDLKNPSVLKDVRFRLLTFTIRLILFKNRKIKGRKLIIFPLAPEERYSDRVTLCKLNKESEIGWFIKFLIRRAFKFKKIKRKNELSVLDLLKDLKSEVLQALNTSRKEDFKESLDELVDFIVTLISASSVSRINYSTIRDSSQHIFARSEFSNWFKILEEISKPICDKIDQDPAYARELVYLPRKILYRLDSDTPSEIKLYVIKMFYGVFIHTSEWWSRTLENQGLSVHNSCEPALLSPPYSGTYKDLIRLFIGHFEQAKNTAIIPMNDRQLSWQEYQRLFNDLASHLEINSRILFRAINNGDKVGVKYSMDTLLKWYSQIANKFDSHGIYRINNKDFVHNGLVVLSWDELTNEYDLFDKGVEISVAQKGLFLAVCRNYWKDTCSVILYLLYDMHKTCNSDKVELLSYVYEGIINGNHPLKDDGSIRNPEKPVIGFNDLLNSMIRQNYSGFMGAERYGAILDSLIDKLKPNRVSDLIVGRVSSSWGDRSLQSLNSGFIVMLMQLISKTEVVSEEQKKLIRKWILKDPIRMESFKRDVNSLLNIVEEPDDEIKEVFNSISVNGKKTYEDSLKFSLSFLKELKEEIEGIWKSIVFEAEVDYSLIEEMEKWGNIDPSNVLSKRQDLLFGTVNYKSQNLLDENSIKYKIDKSYVTKPILRPSGIDKRFIEDTVKRYLLAFIYSNIKSEMNPEKVDVNDDDEEYWKTIIDFENESLKKELNPILVINSTYYPDWLSTVLGNHTSDDYVKPDNIEFVKFTDSELYIGKINNVKVLVSSNLVQRNESLLTVEEEFESIEVGDFKERNLVKIDLIEEGEEFNLKIAIKTKVKLAGHYKVTICF